MNKLIFNIKTHLDKYLNTPNKSVKGSHFIINSNIYKDINLFQKEQILLTSNQTIIGLKEDCDFKKVCPHRGASLKKLDNKYVCPYHGWEFDLDGKLLNTTGDITRYKKGSISLQKNNVYSLGPMSFTHSSLGEFDNEIIQFTKDGNFLKKLSFIIHANWKFIIESLFETYHFQFAHKKFLGNFKNSMCSLIEFRNKDSRITIPLADFESFKNHPSLNGINIMYFKYPSTFLLILHDSFIWFDIKPNSIDQSTLTSYCFLSDKGDIEKALNSFNVLVEILNEDFQIIEGQQKNIHEVDNMNFHLTPYEIGIKHFHNSLH